MNFTQNEKLNQVTADTLIVGVDIGSQTHFARVFLKNKELNLLLLILTV